LALSRQLRKYSLIVACLAVLLSMVVFGRPSCTKTPEFVFLYVRETNNSLLSEPPTGPVQGAFPAWSADPPRLEVAGAPPPPANAELVVLHDVEDYDILVCSQLLYGSTPRRLPLAAPVQWQQQACDHQGALQDRISINNAGRFPPSTLMVESILADGTVSLEVDGEKITLAPGNSWLVARGLVDNELKSVRAGPEWDPFVQAQLEQNRPLTVFSVHNYGWWPRAALEGGR